MSRDGYGGGSCDRGGGGRDRSRDGGDRGGDDRGGSRGGGGGGGGDRGGGRDDRAQGQNSEPAQRVSLLIRNLPLECRWVREL